MEYIKRMVVCLICLAAIATVICINIRADDVVTNAKAAVLIEPESGKILHSKNMDAKLQMASTTKIMSAILTIESGNIDEPFTVDSEAIRVEGSSMGLIEGDTVTKRALCYGMLLPSGNDAANAAAVAVAGSVEDFVALMNKKAEELGLNSTHFVTPSGLDDFTDSHYSTAYDMAKLAAYALKNDVFREICSTKSISLDLGGRSLWLGNTNKLLGTCEGVFGVKTGFTDKAGRCLITACERGGISLICVTLGDSTDWIDHTNLYDYGYSVLERIELGGDSYKVAAVGGNENVVELKSEKVLMTVDKGCAERIEKTVMLPQFIYAPTEKGSVCGQVVYSVDGGVIAVLELKLSEDLTLNNK